MFVRRSGKMMREVAQLFLFITIFVGSLSALLFSNVSFSTDSTSIAIENTMLSPRQLQPKITASSPTQTIVAVARSGSPTLTCPEGYALTAANVGTSYYWNPTSKSSVTWYCNDTCNKINFFGCGCPHSGCPGGCFAGCPSTYCESSKTSYSGGWETSNKFIIKNSTDYQTVSYVCSKIENKYGNPVA